MSTFKSFTAAIVAAVTQRDAQRRAELSARCYRLIASDRAQRRLRH